ncbi:MAG: hypothetical protein EOO74_04160 [Myxococcales bacterium]|nr:MAG: hypothetical protein EOO74_04160 [Myxococcales bacterium]
MLLDGGPGEPGVTRAAIEKHMKEVAQSHYFTGEYAAVLSHELSNLRQHLRSHRPKMEDFAHLELNESLELADEAMWQVNNNLMHQAMLLTGHRPESPHDAAESVASLLESLGGRDLALEITVEAGHGAWLGSWRNT